MEKELIKFLIAIPLILIVASVPLLWKIRKTKHELSSLLGILECYLIAGFIGIITQDITILYMVFGTLFAIHIVIICILAYKKKKN